MTAAITEDPVIPIRFGSEQKGMQTGGEIDNVDEARKRWLIARDDAIYHAQKLADLGVHESICNRLTEPFMWITATMTATEWANFFRLRCHPDSDGSSSARSSMASVSPADRTGVSRTQVGRTADACRH